MYTSPRPQDHHALYLRLVRDIMRAAPSTRSYVESINNQIKAGEFYKALKQARRLIAYEKQLIEFATRQRNHSPRRQGSPAAKGNPAAM
jgi:flagellar protein FlbT